VIENSLHIFLYKYLKKSKKKYFFIFIKKHKAMIIKNNKPKAQWFRYKVNGKVAKVYFAAYETVDVQGLTDTSQILSNTYERRLRHIEEAFGYNFTTAFEVPGD